MIDCEKGIVQSNGVFDYREFLKGKLGDRMSKNPGYSLRAFARDLHLESAQLSDVLNGRYGISKNNAIKIAERLSIQGLERDLFVSSVESFHARSKIVREQASKKLADLEALNNTDGQITLDTFKVISDWYHFAIVALTGVDEFESKSSWIAKRLGVQVELVDQAIERLLRLGILKCENEKWVATEDFFLNATGVPSEASQKFHRQLLEKAIQALSLQTVDERDCANMVFAFDFNEMEDARNEIKAFRRRFVKKYGQGKNTHVYCFGTTFYRISGG